jgi:hypothetical protein
MALATKLDEIIEPLVEVVALQSSAIVDHVCTIQEDVLTSLIPDEVGGSHRVEMGDIQTMLANVGEYYSKAGGSAANTVRGLAGFGIKALLVSRSP